MTPAHTTNLIERCRTTPTGQLEAWSIQGRYGVAILATGIGFALIWAHLTLAGSQTGGVRVMGGIAAFLLLFGTAICRLRETLRVDNTGIHVVSRSVFHTQQWHAPRDAVRRVLLREVAEHVGESSSIRYDLLLEVAVEEVGTELRFFRNGSEPPARRMGAEVSRALQLPFVDAIGDKEEEVAHDALHMRRPEQTAHAGPPPPRIREDTRSGSSSLVIQGTMSPQVAGRFRIAGWAFFAMSSLLGSLISQLTEPAWLGWAIPFPFWGASIYFLAAGWLGDHSREHVSVEQGVIAREVELLGRRWRRAEIQGSALRSLRVQAESASTRGVALVCDERILVAGTGLAEGELDWLHCWLAERLR